MVTEVTKAAFHEAAHAIYAYIVGYKCRSMKIDEEGNGHSILECGDDTYFVKVFKKYYTTPAALTKWFNGLSKNEKIHACLVAEKLCLIHISGAVAESILANGLGIPGKQEIEISGPDVVIAENLSKIFHFDLEKQVCQVRKYYTQEMWHVTELLANSIIDSGDEGITKSVIETTFGCSDFGKKLINKNNT